MFKKPLSRLSTPILGLPRAAKRLVALTVDICLCVFAVWIAYYLRLGEFISFTGQNQWAHGAIWATIISIGLAIPIFMAAGLYRAIFRYSGWPALLAVARSVSIYGLVYISVFTVIGVAGVPRTVGIIQVILLLLLVGASRAFARIWLGDQYLSILKRASRPQVLVYGAGATGRQLVAAMANSHKMKVIGFLDDDDRLHGHVLNGVPIYDPKSLVQLVSSLKISDVLLAMPSISRKRRNEILSQIRSARVSVRTLPSVTDLAQGKVSVSDLRELDLDDLLGREPVLPDQELLAVQLRGKTVMVTGAGGSIGSELCRQILAFEPSAILLVERSEYSLYAIHQELAARLPSSHTAVVPLLASVQDFERVCDIMSTWQPDIVYHTAAYKHVPLVEHNLSEGIKNNVLGTLLTAQAAIKNHVPDFVLISTDKAVRPTNIMGASKRLAEMVLQALEQASEETNFSMVRFGNVLGSSGSVVPKFREQIRQGGPLTLTHTDITRYFMTIPEASQLVIQAGAMSKGGDVFVLDMGQPVKIIDLARRIVELSGLTIRDNENPDGDIEVEVIGLRPGEKLYEELLIGDNPQLTPHPRIMKALEDFIPWVDLEKRLHELSLALKANDVVEIRHMMQQLVSGYSPTNEIVDWVYLKNRSNSEP